MKTGILGGTFNPIHNGHLFIAERAYEEFGLDRVLFMPTAVSYLKDQSEILDKDIRIEMIKLAIENNSHFELSTYEADKGGNTYTYETLEYLKSSMPDNEFYFITGEDTLFSMENWVRPEDIFKNAFILSAPRIDRDNVRDPDAIKDQALYLKEKYSARIGLLRSPEINISSSRIREIRSIGGSIRYLVPDKVCKYMEENDLYRK
ncbi:MAG: nicotinate-nucleotide adenylyltransferase [Lachnospiraceae bacterium]|nr:nicotinate-nucleotide adenylyltransferase [Lachnospiraceae bacterium]